MLSRRRAPIVAAALVASLAALPAGAASPLPHAAGARHATLIGQTPPTPTQIAVGAGTVFVAVGAGSDANPGGVFVVAGGKATRLADSPPGAYGVAWSNGTLYVSAGADLLAWSGWNGTDFTERRVVVRMPDGFSGFSGLAVDPSGRIFTGVQIGDFKTGDAAHGTTLYANDLLAIAPATGAVSVVARNIRQPWQLVFPAGATAPVVTDLGQDNLGRTQPPDLLIVGRQGADFGFPVCTWAFAKACARFAKPLWKLPAHSSPMGIAAVGKTLYVALFGGIGQPSRLVTLPVKGGPPTTILSGFAKDAGVMALGAAGSTVYAGDASGRIFRVR